MKKSIKIIGSILIIFIVSLGFIVATNYDYLVYVKDSLESVEEYKYQQLFTANYLYTSPYFNSLSKSKLKELEKDIYDREIQNFTKLLEKRVIYESEVKFSEDYINGVWIYYYYYNKDERNLDKEFIKGKYKDIFIIKNSSVMCQNNGAIDINCWNK